jgi:hypothetical protein
LRAFSLSGRAPAVRATWRASDPESPSDGWFHEFTLPFSGELSIPLGAEGDRNAGFELEGRPKGFVYESYVRRGLSSVGGALFVGDDRWLANITGTATFRNHHLLVSVGTAKFRSGVYDFRLSVGDSWVPRPWFAAGLRLDYQSARGLRPAVLPHFNFSVPGSKYTFLFAIEQKLQKNNLAAALEASLVF